MKVLHVIASLAPRYGGPSKACPELCRELVRRGSQVAIFTTNVDGRYELDVPLDGPVRDGGVEIRYFPVQAPRHYRFSLPLARALKETVPGCDVVHIHSLYLFPSTVAAIYCRRYGVPYIVRPHGTLDPYHFRYHRVRKWIYERLFEWRNLNQAAAVHFTSLGERDLARRLRLRAPDVVVPLGVELSDFAPGNGVGGLQLSWPEARGKKVILFLGRLSAKKGLDLLVKALRLVAEKREDVHLLVAGPDDKGYGGRVRRWLVEEGVSGSASFAGMLLGEEKLAALRQADLFVLPSYTENFGIAVAEAMAAGLPVVISNRVNIWKEVVGARAGLVTQCDPEQIAGAILQLLDDPVGAKAMGERGRKLVRDQFSWKVVGEQMLGVYERLASARHSCCETRAD